MTDRVIAVRVTTNDPATFDAWSFHVKQWRRSDYNSVGGAVHLGDTFTMKDARDQAMREQWRARDLVTLFGRATEIDAYAIARRDFDDLRIHWLALGHDLQQRALASAIDERDPKFVMEHWRYLDRTLLAAAVELMIGVDDHCDPRVRAERKP